MEQKRIKNLTPLMPDKHPQGELFLCDIADAAIKGDMASMEHPIFSLSKKPDFNKKIYEHNGNTLSITPSFSGHATIYDKDILIYAISQIMAKKNQGLEISQTVTFDAKDALIFMNRNIGGKDYRALESSLRRLSGTRIETNIVTGGEVTTEMFGLIENATIHRKHKDGRVLSWAIKLSDWLYNAVSANEVLTLHPDYFRLRKPIEKRIYELARKHCGTQKQWSISLPLLKKKSGSGSDLRTLRFILNKIAENNHLPDYSITITDDVVCFINKKFVEAIAESSEVLKLDTTTYEKAKKAAPLWDVYYLENQWRSWMYEGGMPSPDNPDAAFIGYCKSWYKRNGDP